MHIGEARLICKHVNESLKMLAEVETDKLEALRIAKEKSKQMRRRL